MGYDTEKQPITDSQEFLVITQYYHALVSDLERASKLCEYQKLISDIRLALKRLPKIRDNIHHRAVDLYALTSDNLAGCIWDDTINGGRTFTRIGRAISYLEDYEDLYFQSNNPKHFGDVKPEDEFVSKQVTSLMFYGCLCSVYNYLKKLPKKFKKDETDAMKNFFTYLKTIHEGLKVFLYRRPRTISGVQKINRALDRDVLYSPQMCNSYTILCEYLPYRGNLFDDLAQAEKHSYWAFISGADGCTELMGQLDPILKVSSFTEKTLVTSTMELYFKYVLHFLDKGLAKSDIMKEDAENAEAEKENALAQLTKVTSQPYSLQLQMAKEYLANQK